jgi:hypothetical protein
MENKTLPAILVIVLAIVCIGIVIFGLRVVLLRSSWPPERQNSVFLKTVVAIIAWIILIGILALLGFFDLSSLPPRPVFIFLVAIVVAFILAFSKPVSELLKVTPIHWLVYVQSFRIAVELILWQGFYKGLLPVQMTFEGYNYDIFTGIFAIPFGWMISRNPNSAKITGVLFNVMGIALLLNIVTIAILSMPNSLRTFTNDPSSAIVGEFPFIYIPGVFVVLAVFMHIFSLRQLSLSKRSDVR